MTRREVIGILSVGTASLAIGGCGLLNSRASYRFRMTVEMDTPQGLRAGSSVYEVVAEKNNTRLLAEERAGGVITRGEAVVVDVPGGAIYVLLTLPKTTNGLGAVATYALSPETERGGIDNFLPAVKKLGGWFGDAKAELPREDWPLMVWFGDINDPKTVQRVEPDAIGVKRILLESTGDEVTTGIERTLKWLGDRGGVVSGPTFNANLTETIYNEAFRLGISK